MISHNLEENASSHAHDKRLNILKLQCIGLKEYVDRMTEKLAALDSGGGDGKKVKRVQCRDGIIPKTLTKNTNYSSAFMRRFVESETYGDDCGNSGSNRDEEEDDEDEDEQEEEEEIEADEGRTEQNVSSKKIEEEENIGPLSVFSTCEICFTQTFFENYEIFKALKLEKWDLFKGCTLDTVVEIILNKNLTEIERYLLLTYGEFAEDCFKSERLKTALTQKVLRDFYKHYTECLYSRQKFIPIKTLFKSRLDDLRNMNFSNHTFDKLYGKENQIQCPRTSLCAFITDKCKGYSMYSKNPLILRYIEASHNSHANKE